MDTQDREKERGRAREEKRDVVHQWERERRVRVREIVSSECRAFSHPQSPSYFLGPSLKKGTIIMVGESIDFKSVRRCFSALT